MAASTSVRHARCAVLSSAHICDADNEEVLPIGPETSRSDEPDPWISSGVPYFSEVVSFRMLTMNWTFVAPTG